MEKSCRFKHTQVFPYREIEEQESRRDQLLCVQRSTGAYPLLYMTRNAEERLESSLKDSVVEPAGTGP